MIAHFCNKSTRINKINGNDTIHRYPLPCEGKLTKLLCISKEAFEKLKAALDKSGLGPKPASLEPKTPFRKKLLRKKPLEGYRDRDLKPDDKYTGSYEPSNILYTQSSSLWRTRNLGAWFKEQDSYEDFRYIKSYPTET
jgi:hypothetical protein